MIVRSSSEQIGPRRLGGRCFQRRQRSVGSPCCLNGLTSASPPTSLKEIQNFLARGATEDEAKALRLVRALRDSGDLVAFDAGRRLPKRAYSLSDLRLHKIDASKLLSPEENTLTRLRTYAVAAYIASLSVGVLTETINISTATGLVILTGLLIGVDQVEHRQPRREWRRRCRSELPEPIYQKRVALHEAGHFLVAYLCGLMPKNYTLSALDYFKKYQRFNIQAGTTFCDSEFQREIQEGQLSASSLDRVTCVAVAGVVAEYLSFGQSEGGLNDILQLDRLMRSLRFSQKKVDSEVRWAVMNTFSLLRRHRKVHRELADYMRKDRPVTECIWMIEQRLRNATDI